MSYPVILILTSVVMGVIGQLTLKAGLNRLGPLSLADGGPLAVARRISSSPFIVVGLGIFGIGTFFWLAALSRVELGFAYPFLSLSYVIVLFSSWLFFREQLSAWRVLGVTAICLGIYIVTRS